MTHDVIKQITIFTQLAYEHAGYLTIVLRDAYPALRISFDGDDWRTMGSHEFDDIWMAEFGQQLQFSNIHCRSAAAVVGHSLSLRCSLNSDMATLRPRNLPMYTLIVNVDRTVHSLLETATAYPLQLLQLRRLDDRIFQTQLGQVEVQLVAIRLGV